MRFLHKKWRGASIVAVSFIVIFTGLLVFTQHNQSFYEDPIAEVKETTVVDEAEQTIDGEAVDTVYTQEIEAILKNGEHIGETITLINDYADSGVYHPEFTEGDQLFVTYDQTDNELTGDVIHVKRDHQLVWLSGLFLLVLIAVGKRRGVLAGVSLMVNILIISYALDVYIATQNISLLVIMSVAVVLMTAFSLLLISGFTYQTYAAITATILGTFSLMAITLSVLLLTDYQGLRFEEMDFLTRPPQAVFMAGVLIGALGAVMDVAVTIASTLFSLADKNRNISNRDLKQSGLEVGKDIMGTMTNILFFAYVSGAIPALLVYFSNGAPLGFTLSMNLSLELTRALAGGIGIVLTIPISLYTTIYFINRKRVSV
ncbi:Uncharacterized membrane protein [Pelagirhabdus alkalitolerans]|uniref:Uncharacterized membrane protein n=1 Tax=Pelagirhabdus alkalitolerans TaxID=1612202 RepID=A0A1G6GMM1_9BACI|nr:YibE/F family protein [Pelagirhabdus alkalitolerans]SDB83217.1 Uncharacterized membrane protein [Pelagirhabdus alkalitolerans]